jgi:hypothetical protein
MTLIAGAPLAGEGLVPSGAAGGAGVKAAEVEEEEEEEEVVPLAVVVVVVVAVVKRERVRTLCSGTPWLPVRRWGSTRAKSERKVMSATRTATCTQGGVSRERKQEGDRRKGGGGGEES